MEIPSPYGFLRAEFLSLKLLTIAVAIAEREGATVDRCDGRMLDVPLCDGDVEAESGLPTAAVAPAPRIAVTDALLIASPRTTSP